MQTSKKITPPREVIVRLYALAMNRHGSVPVIPAKGSAVRSISIYQYPSYRSYILAYRLTGEDTKVRRVCHIVPNAAK